MLSSSLAIIMSEVNKNPLSLEQLSLEVNRLREVVNKQTTLLGSTGQKVMELSIRSQRNDIASLNLGDNNNGSPAKSLRNPAPSYQQPIDTSDFMTSEDIVQLVGELQGQLDQM